jgi:hypothetical protein
MMLKLDALESSVEIPKKFLNAVLVKEGKDHLERSFVIYGET